MTEGQLTSKIMKISSDLGMRGHQTTKRIIHRIEGFMPIIEWLELYNLYQKPWKFGYVTHIVLINSIETILHEKGILS